MGQPPGLTPRHECDELQVRAVGEQDELVLGQAVGVAAAGREAERGAEPGRGRGEEGVRD